MEKQTAFKILVIIFLINLGISGYLFYKENYTAQICLTGDNSCQVVQDSPYARILGIPNAIIGLIVFPIFLIFLFLHKKHNHIYLERFLSVCLAIGVLYAVRLIYAQFMVLKQICPYCLTTDILTIISFGVYYFYYLD